MTTRLLLLPSLSLQCALLLISCFLVQVINAEEGPYMFVGGNNLDGHCVALKVLTEKNVDTFVGQVCAKFKDDTQEFLQVTYDTSSTNYVIENVQVFYSHDPALYPKDSVGKPDPSQFEYQEAVDALQMFSLDVALDPRGFMTCPNVQRNPSDTGVWTRTFVAHATVRQQEGAALLDVYGHEGILFSYNDIDQGREEYFSYFNVGLVCTEGSTDPGNQTDVSPGQNIFNSTGNQPDAPSGQNTNSTQPENGNKPDVPPGQNTNSSQPENGNKPDVPPGQNTNSSEPEDTDPIEVNDDIDMNTTSAPTDASSFPSSMPSSLSSLESSSDLSLVPTVADTTTTAPTSSEASPAPSAAPSNAPSNTKAPSLVIGDDLVVGLSFVVITETSKAVNNLPHEMLQESFEGFERDILEDMKVPLLEIEGRRQLWVKYNQSTFNVYHFLVNTDCIPNDEMAQAVSKSSSLRPPPTQTQCHRAYARFAVRIVNEDPTEVCETLRNGTLAGFRQGRLQEAHERLHGVNSTVQLKPGDFEYCVPIDEFEVPNHGEESAWTDSNPLANLTSPVQVNEGNDSMNWFIPFVIVSCLLCALFTITSVCTYRQNQRDRAMMDDSSKTPNEEAALVLGDEDDHANYEEDLAPLEISQ